MIITISGKPGSGKTTLANMLAEKIGYKHYYMGGMRREIAQKKGLTLHELNTLGEKENWTDSEVDEYQRKIGQTEDSCIVEGRTSFYFIPHSLKIFVDVDPRVGAERVYNDLKKKSRRNEDSNLTSADAVLESHKKRIASDVIRYEKYYGIDVYDKAHYDFTLDTSKQSVPQSFEKLYKFVQKKMKLHSARQG